MKPIGYLSGIAAGTTFSNTSEPGLRMQMIADAGAALLLLLVITTISVYKPWGRTKQGMKSKQLKISDMQEKRTNKRSWKTYALIGGFILLILIIIKHLADGGMGHH